MTDDERNALVAAGWRFGDAEDFLGLTQEERDEADRLGDMLQGTMSLEGRGLSYEQLAKIKIKMAAKLRRIAEDES